MKACPEGIQKGEKGKVFGVEGSREGCFLGGEPAKIVVAPDGFPT
jgi:hypothetical protein